MNNLNFGKSILAAQVMADEIVDAFYMERLDRTPAHIFRDQASVDRIFDAWRV